MNSLTSVFRFGLLLIGRLYLYVGDLYIAKREIVSPNIRCEPLSNV